MTSTARRFSLVSVLLTVFLLGTVTSAEAATVTLKDKKDAPKSIDIRSVKVKHTKTKVVITLKIRDLPKKHNPNADYFVWIDSNRRSGSPNFMMGSWAMHQSFATTKGWVSAAGELGYGDLTNCSFSTKRNGKKNTVTFTTTRACLGYPGKVRVSASAHLLVKGAWKSDYAKKSKAFTKWVKKG